MTVDTPSTRPLLDKLGVKPGAKVALMNMDDPAFVKLLRGRIRDIQKAPPDDACDLVFIGVEIRAHLARIAQAKNWIEPNGAIWVVRPKGGRSEVRDIDVIEAGLGAGLVDNKIASFSETHGAMRLVYRIKDRPAAGSRTAHLAR